MPAGCCRLRAAASVAAALLLALPAVLAAHVGTSNAYFDGGAGPYGIRVIVRTPGVIPGLAQATVRIVTGDGVERVTVRPLRSDVGLAGAPPPDIASPVPGEARLYSADLWLMTSGSYSIEVAVAGTAGEGTVYVPVLAAAERRLAMHPAIGVGLAAAALFLFAGALTILGAALREGVLEPGIEPDRRRRWLGRLTMGVGGIVLAALLWGGWTWWDAVDSAYESRLYRPWSTTATVDSQSGQESILRLVIDDPDWGSREATPGGALVPDHGKLMHMFLVRADDLAAFAHLHPVPDGDDAFVTRLPPLPAGDYRVYADIVHESGFAPTLVDQVTLTRPSPVAEPIRRAPAAGHEPAPDPDDSWSVLEPRGAASGDRVRLPSGRTLGWQPEGALVADQDLTLSFAVAEPDGTPSALQPYMSMLSHAAVFRHDGSVFVHLHPAGSINMTAQQRFTRAAGAQPRAMELPAPTDRVTFPFVFPEPGSWRIVVQVRVGGMVETGAFDLDVDAPDAGAE